MNILLYQAGYAGLPIDVGSKGRALMHEVAAGTWILRVHCYHIHRAITRCHLIAASTSRNYIVPRSVSVVSNLHRKPTPQSKKLNMNTDVPKRIPPRRTVVRKGRKREKTPKLDAVRRHASEITRGRYLSSIGPLFLAESKSWPAMAFTMGVYGIPGILIRR